MNEDTTRSAQRQWSAQTALPVTWRLHVAVSPCPAAVGRILTLQVGRTVFGRAPGDDGLARAFADPQMSRQHLALVHLGGHDALEVEDLKSHNGTWLGGRRVLRARVGHGAVLRLGGTVLIVESDLNRHAGFDTPTPAIPGRSEAARTVRAELDMAARDALPVLITGETGTGKELAAEELHRLSGRRGALVRVNLAALSENLFESELFGHTRAAFTGAGAAVLGRIREADGGTLVCDEIGELPQALQPKLLRVLEEGVLRPVGGTADVAIDVRFVASTNANLEALAMSGRFRRDLLARFRSHTVHLPPLSARRPDLMQLADAVHPVRDAAGQLASWRDVLTVEAAEILHLCDWRHNLRDLRAALVRATHGMQQGSVGEAALPPDLVARVRQQVMGAVPTPQTEAALPPAQAAPSHASSADRPDAATLHALLARHHGSVERIAEEVGRHRRQVYRWLDYAGIDAETVARYRQGGGTDR